MDCIFCKIINGDIPCYKVYEDNDILAFLDINPVSVGHTLIIPKKHTLDLYTIDDDTLVKIMNKAKDISKVLADKLGATGFSVTQNNGSLQEVKHYHLHVIPKYNKKMTMNIEETHKTITN